MFQKLAKEPDNGRNETPYLPSGGDTSHITDITDRGQTGLHTRNPSGQITFRKETVSHGI